MTPWPTLPRILPATSETNSKMPRLSSPVEFPPLTRPESWRRSARFAKRFKRPRPDRPPRPPSSTNMSSTCRSNSFASLISLADKCLKSLLLLTLDTALSIRFLLLIASISCLLIDLILSRIQSTSGLSGLVIELWPLIADLCRDGHGISRNKTNYAWFLDNKIFPKGLLDT